MINVLSPQFRKVVTDILSNVGNNTMDIDCKFYSTVNGTYEYDVPFFDSPLYIVRNFTSSYTDIININVLFNLNDYVTLTENIIGLRCRLTLRFFDTDTQERGNVIKVIDHKVIIKNREDIIKKYPTGLFKPSEEFALTEQHGSNLIDVEFDLIDDIIYNARKSKMNFILRKSTMEDTLRTISKILKFKNTALVIPHNTKLYENIIIPPNSDISTIYRLLQQESGYGIYNEGISYYYTEDVMYIYPLFEASPKIENIDSVINIYDVGASQFEGMYSYNTIIDGDIHFISHLGSDTIHHKETRLEMAGNSFINMPSNKIIDYHITKNNEIEIPENLRQINQFVMDGISENVYTPKFTHTDNEFSLCSELTSSLITIVVLGWAHSIPFSFKPGKRIAYHYETNNGEYKKVSGVCTEIKHTITPIKTVGIKVYTSTAQLALLIDEA